MRKDDDAMAQTMRWMRRFRRTGGVSAHPDVESRERALVSGLRCVEGTLAEMEKAVENASAALGRLAHGERPSLEAIAEQRQICRAQLENIRAQRAAVRAQLEIV